VRINKNYPKERKKERHLEGVVERGQENKK
jgi:hypothetical protein